MEQLLPTIYRKYIREPRIYGMMIIMEYFAPGVLCVAGNTKKKNHP